MGSFPIAQVREPFSTVQYIAERLDLPQLLKLQHPEGDDEWSSLDICDGKIILNYLTPVMQVSCFNSWVFVLLLGWAIKRGFYTAKAARPDSHRAANHLLRMALDGKITMCLNPPEYNKKKGLYTYIIAPYFLLKITHSICID